MVMKNSPNYLFVYGLLQPSELTAPAQLLKEHAQYLGRATAEGHLFLVSYYPAFTPTCDTPQVISGHLYEFTSDYRYIFKTLDEFEECSENHQTPHEYVRALLDINFNGKIIKAWTYIYNHPTEKLLPIYSGYFSSELIG